MAFLCVLAYPGEYEKRDRFMWAAKARWGKDLVPRGKRAQVIRPEYRADNKNIENSLRRASERIVTRRLPAARLLHWKVLSNHGRLAVDGALIKGPHSIITAMAGTLGHNLGKYNEAVNVRRLAWKETLPALHLALQLEQALDGANLDIMELIHNPKWLRLAVETAEAWRIPLAQYLKTHETIQILPE